MLKDAGEAKETLPRMELDVWVRNGITLFPLPSGA